MNEWQPTGKHLKRYPHFDAPLSLRELKRIANNPDLVAQNPFFPFIRFVNSHVPFRPGNTAGKIKQRELRYGSRRDAAIFSRYRDLLSERYENELKKRGLGQIPIAYRRIPKAGSYAGKSNVNFAKEAFEEIKRQRNCLCITMDIKDYFESLDHSRIKSTWEYLLNVSFLPKDHYAVFKNVTKYSIVDREKLLKRLGYVDKYHSTNPKKMGLTVRKQDIPYQLCTPDEFRRLVAGGDGFHTSLIKKNTSSNGIPQGAPISDVIANFYLIDFDEQVKNYVESVGGYYRRYCDDLLIIVPSECVSAKDVEVFIEQKLQEHGSTLELKQNKTAVTRFYVESNALKYEAISGKRQNGLEYLGFRFDGSRVYLRNATISAFHRKMIERLRAHAITLAKRYPGKDAAEIYELTPIDCIIQNFGRVRDFDPNQPYNARTFWSYVREAKSTFGKDAEPITKQVSDYRERIKYRFYRELERTVKRRINNIGK